MFYTMYSWSALPARTVARKLPHDMTTETIRSGPRRPIWGVISVCCPFAGLLLGLWALLGIAGKEAAGLVLCVLIIVFSCFLGIFSAAIALARAERFWPLTLLGIALNSIPLGFVALGYVRYL